MGTSNPASHNPGQSLFGVVRYWSRRWTSAGQAVDVERGRDVMVAEAVAGLQGSGGATVNQVADELGIDQSGASRFISQAVERGYLHKVASPSDARHRLLRVTDEGDRLLDSAHRWQDSVFAELIAGWPADDVRQFQLYLQRFGAAQDERR
ncbi:MarR family winged helix-turn-helix transcriptional regulator [Kribbella solani]|uniref:MarR family winged helix-turn-helix transcriptional regulator n=1 Tax=Kribbella solani TaxID=236067 RepID=UPI0029BB5FF1|nr:MarR family winged helix-turn-helix transcriptional regulator [Kribbella solani]MDX2968399.1 MarR family winged helix-turn-helix transcriptional regulator [Kribbella solani]MDX3005081.1 MarR family winged helix-turn-helix transcriptional regulator [Kribbella solani]